MNMENLKKELLELLSDDVEVRSAILSLMDLEMSAESDDSSELNNELERLRQNNEALELKNKACERTISEFESLKISNKDTIDHLTSKCSHLETHINELLSLDTVCQKYMCLSETIRTDLKSIIVGKSTSTILISLSINGRLEMFWDYLKEKIINDQIGDMKQSSIDFFEVYFGLLKETDDKYQLLEVEKGVPFDSDLMIRHSDGKVNGPVSEVLLQGYSRAGRIIKKTIVKL